MVTQLPHYGVMVLALPVVPTLTAQRCPSWGDGTESIKAITL